MPIEPGQTIGQYLVKNKIGEGGMGAVYLAQQSTVHRAVVLKVLTANIANDSAALDRFKREVDIIARLEHPYILPVYDFGQVDGNPYIVMRYMGGGSLLERLRAKDLSPEQLLRNLEQIAEALDYAHDRDVIHRDIKPGNVLLDERGNVCLADFGLAKTMEGSGDLTATGSILGTPPYMSPEQARGEKLDGRSDIYSLAVLTYEALAGRLPFIAKTPWEYIQKHLAEPPPSILSVAPGLPPAVDDLLNRALAKDRNERPARATDFVKALRAALTAAPPLAASGGQAQPSVRATARAAAAAPTNVFVQQPTLQPTLAATRQSATAWALPILAVVFGGGLVVVAVIAAVIFFAIQSNTPKVSTYPVGDSPRALAFDGEAVWVANFFDNTVSRLAATNCASSSDPCGLAIGTYPVDDLPVGLAFDGNSLWVATALNSTLAQLDPQSGQELDRYQLSTVPSALLFASGYLWTANSFANTVTKISLDGKVVGSYPVGEGPLALASDGVALWVANQTSNTLTQLSFDTGKIVNTVELGGQPTAVTFDGQHVWAALGDQNQVVEVDPASGAILSQVNVGRRPVALVAGGSWLWSADQDGNSLTGIDPLTAKVKSTIAVAGGPFALAWVSCGDKCSDVWVAGEGNDTVSRVRVDGK